MNTLELDFISKQKAICNKYNTGFVASPFNTFIGVALTSFEKLDLPIHGLRHTIESEQASSWYIWAGAYSQADDFFQPVHIGHLLEVCPKALQYLGLGPGWRFLFDNVYEDVWYDQRLLL